MLAATGASTLLLFAAAFALLQMSLRQQRLAARIQICRGQAPVAAATRQDMIKGAWSWVLAAVGQMILRTGLLSAHTLADLEVTLASSRLRGRRGLEVFIGSKIGLLIGLPLLTIAVLRGIHLPYVLTIAIPFAAAIAGLLLPDIVVRHRRKTYLQAVERGLPDALDLLLICAQAGLGLTAAIVRVADEMQDGNQDIGLEFALTANEHGDTDRHRRIDSPGKYAPPIHAVWHPPGRCDAGAVSRNAARYVGQVRSQGRAPGCAAHGSHDDLHSSLPVSRCRRSRRGSGPKFGKSVTDDANCTDCPGIAACRLCRS
jgi:hypothetical protein